MFVFGIAENVAMPATGKREEEPRVERGAKYGFRVLPHRAYGGLSAMNPVLYEPASPQICIGPR